jgi:hypothetical protein
MDVEVGGRDKHWLFMTIPKVKGNSLGEGLGHDRQHGGWEGKVGWQWLWNWWD